MAMTEQDIAETIRAFAQAAADAKTLGFDAVEIHGAHGYLVDQFFWHPTNQRTDGTAAAVWSSAPVSQGTDLRRPPSRGAGLRDQFSHSQWKLQDYAARLATTPQAMEQWLIPLVKQAVDIFHCSQRRFWEPEFTGSDLTLPAGQKN